MIHDAVYQRQRAYAASLSQIFRALPGAVVGSLNRRLTGR